MIRGTLLCAALTSVFAAWACSSDPAATPAPTPGGSDAGVDAPGPSPDGATPNDGGTEAGKPFPKPTPFAVPLSATGPDQLQALVAGPGGTFYAAGFAAETVTGPKMLTVVKMTATGPDATFGTAGVVKTTVEVAGAAGEIALAVQPGGKLVIAASVPNATDPADRDVALVRLDDKGALDTTFGVDGVRVLDLNTAVDSTQNAQRDGAHALTIGSAGEIYLHARTRGDGARTDSDFAIVKLTEAGALDTTFNAAGATPGKITLDFGAPSANAAPRGIVLLADGSLIASGYATSSLVGNTAQVVLYKVSGSTGAAVTAFGDNGLFHQVVLTLQTEAYNIALHGTKIVTGGYGRNTGTTNDWVSLRFDTVTGARDTGWGGAANGAVFFDPGGKALGSNCRNTIALPGGKTLLLGSTGPSNTTTQDAAFAVLDANGRLDTSYGTGINLFPFGAGEGGSDQFWGAAVSGDKVMVVGYKGAGATQTEALNDDAYGVAFPLQ